MKRRILSALLALLLTIPPAFALVSCDKSGDGGDTGGTSSGQDETTVPGPLIDPNEPYDGYVLRALSDGYDISDNLFGIFLEDINYGVDGGLYAELICNRSFEFGRLAGSGAKECWAVSGSNCTFTVVDGSANGTSLNANNPHYARVINGSDNQTGIMNSGFFNDMHFDNGAEYRLTFYARGVDGYTGGVYVKLLGRSAALCANGQIDSITSEWHKYTITLKSTKDMENYGKLVLAIDKGSVDFDMVSLFPVDTYKGRENGMRRDIAEMIADLHPKFFRFPGGCIIEGSTLDQAYSWKDSIGNGLEFEVNGEKTVGDVAARPIQENLWSWGWQTYYMTYGLGFYEYFQFCEDLDCEPVPVLNCGHSCQGQPGPGGVQTVPIDSPEFKQYIQDALDLVEFCLGGTDTKWGAVRAAMGHPDKFRLTYIAIGNEQWGDAYHERYAKFREAFNEAKEKNPELYGGIKLIMANGPAVSDRYGWDFAEQNPGYVDILDEHYYLSPSWFLMNNSHYDSYDRSAPSVFVGEYAAHTDDRKNNSLAAMAEAAYMTGLERNGDIVELAAYAPMLAYDGHTQWAPNLIWFNSSTVWGSVNYYVQKIYSDNQSERILKSTLDASDYGGAISGKVGVGTWQTSARFDDLTVTDNKTGDVLFSDDFSESQIDSYEIAGGLFAVNANCLLQTNVGAPANSVTGDVIYMGDTQWTDYTLTVKATKTGGSEGFIIPFGVKDRNNFWHWNIGGWNNSVSSLEYTKDGAKSGQVDGTVKPFFVETGHEYEVKIVVSGFSIKCYLDGELMVDYDASGISGVYSVVGEDENDIIIKLVNTTESKVPVLVDLTAVSTYRGKAKTQYIDFISSTTENGAEESPVTIKEGEIDVASAFEYELPMLTMVVIRIPKTE